MTPLTFHIYNATADVWNVIFQWFKKVNNGGFNRLEMEIFQPILVCWLTKSWPNDQSRGTVYKFIVITCVKLNFQFRVILY